MMNIVLIGFMGSGKTTVGRALSAKSDMEFLDTDALIESKEDCKISTIIAEKGEAHFRALENAALKSLAATKDKVISTGGGIVSSPNNRELLKKAGKVIYLRVSPETVIKRLEGDISRPLLMGEDKLSRVEELLSLRRALYESTADRIIDVDDLSVEEIVDSIMKDFT